MTMQNVRDLVPKGRNAFTATAQKADLASQQVVGAKQQAEDAINQIFNQVLVHCPAWKNSYPSTGVLNTAKDEWTKLLIKHSLNKADLDSGFKWLRERQNNFMPSPQEFIDNCKSDGLPTLKAAYDEVAQKAHFAKYPERGREVVYSHPMVQWIAAKVGGVFLIEMPDKKRNESFEAAYNEAKVLAAKGVFDPTKQKQLTREQSDDTQEKLDDALVTYLHFMRMSPAAAEGYRQDMAKRGVHISEDGKSISRDADLRVKQGDRV